MKLEDGTLVQQVSYQADGSNGWFIRGYHEGRCEYLMLDSFFDQDFPKWIKDVKTPLVKGKGIPSALYMDLILMKKFNINLEQLKTVRICNVHEWETIFQLNRLSREHDEDTALGELFKQTKLFRSRNNVLIQTGLKIDDLKIIPQNATFSHPQHLKDQHDKVNDQEIKELCEKYKFDYMGDQVLWNFDVLMNVSSKF